MVKVKNGLGLLLLISCSFIFINYLIAEDEAEKESKPQEESKEKQKLRKWDRSAKEKESEKADAKKQIGVKEPTLKTELKNVEFSGVVEVHKMGKTDEDVYFILTNIKIYPDYAPSKMCLVQLPNKIGDKEIDLSQYKGKLVIAKGVGEFNLVDDNNHGFRKQIASLNQLLSIELKDTKATSEKKTDENKKEDAKKDLGNQSKD